MSFRTELFLAWKYFKPKRSAVSVITLISVIGVGLGVAVLIVVLAVMTGFTDHLKDKLLETGSHAQIKKASNYHYFGGRDSNLILNPDSLVKLVEKVGGEAEPLLLSPVLLQSGDNFAPKGLIGLDPGRNSNRINLKEALRYPAKENFSLKRGEVMISYVIAQQYGLPVGSKILLHAPNRLAKLMQRGKDGRFEATKEASEVYLPGEYTVSGIYSFGKYDFDRDILFMNLDDADELFGYPWGAATDLYVWTKDPFDMDGFLADLNRELKQNAPDCYALSWKQIHSRILSVLQVEKNMQFFLLIFIVLVAAFSITNTLITTVIQKTREIGLLKAMGASSGTVMAIFILQGLFVGVLGTALGTVLGCLIVRYRMLILYGLRFATGQDIFPKEIYQFNELPAHIVGGDLCTIAVISILLCTFGAVIPAIRAAKLDPARALRYE